MITYICAYLLIGIIYFLVNKNDINKAMNDHKKELSDMEEHILYPGMKKIMPPVTIIFWPVVMILDLQEWLTNKKEE